MTSLTVCISLLITFLDPKFRSCDVEKGGGGDFYFFSSNW